MFTIITFEALAFWLRNVERSTLILNQSETRHRLSTNSWQEAARRSCLHWKTEMQASNEENRIFSTRTEPILFGGMRMHDGENRLYSLLCMKGVQMCERSRFSLWSGLLLHFHPKARRWSLPEPEHKDLVLFGDDLVRQNTTETKRTGKHICSWLSTRTGKQTPGRQTPTRTTARRFKSTL